jgi:glucokinase
MFLGIEIGGTKLQIGLGRGEGVISALWRGAVNPSVGSAGIRQQIASAVPELLAKANAARGSLRGVGIGFGGPTDDRTQTVIKSHQIAGWDDFPLTNWISELVGAPAVLCNDADVAGLAEALFGAGRGLSPIFYITVGTGVGGGLIVDGQVYRGVGRGAAEIGHLRIRHPSWIEQAAMLPVEAIASGDGISSQATLLERKGENLTAIRKHCPIGPITAKAVAEAARESDGIANQLLGAARQALAEGICDVIALLCPRRIVIGGGISLMGDDLFFRPLRQLVEERVFKPFSGLTDIVPAALGEEMVVHGALALARQKFGV